MSVDFIVGTFVVCDLPGEWRNSSRHFLPSRFREPVHVYFPKRFLLSRGGLRRSGSECLHDARDFLFEFRQGFADAVE